MLKSVNDFFIQVNKMANSNYENKDDLKNAIKDKLSSLNEKALEAITKALGNNPTSANVKAVEKVEAKDIAKGTDVISSSKGGDVDLSKVSNSILQNLNAIQFSGTEAVNVTIKNNNFKGTVVLGDGDSKVEITSKKSVTVETGAGNDSVTTGSGKDSVVLSGGNDTVNTGAGNDQITITDTFDGNAIIDGGTGKNELDVSNADISDVTVNENGELVINLDNNGSITAVNFQAIVLGDNGVNVDLEGLTSAIGLTVGLGNDSVALGAGKDSVTLTGGNDSVSTGAGDDLVKISSDFTSGNVTLDGGEGKDKLDLRYESIDSVEVVEGVVTVTLDDGSTIEISNFEQFVYDNNGDAPGGVRTVGVITLDNLF